MNAALSNPEVQACFQAAVRNLLEINTVPCDFSDYNATGLLNPQVPFMVRAGGSYETPWTRDASVNTACGMRLLHPEVARNTLFAVCKQNDRGEPIIQPDNQGWDQIVWTIGAWSYYLSSGNRVFLKDAYGVVRRALAALEPLRYNSNFGLFQGGSFFNDGIAGYPLPIHQPGLHQSFAPLHPMTEKIMCLSTNCLYCESYRILARMAALLDDVQTAACAMERHKQLKDTINASFWNDSLGRYDYFLYPDGTHDNSQELSGHAFAVYFGICPEEKRSTSLEALHSDRFGTVTVYPPFSGLFSEEMPGRHNNLIWPFLNGFFICAAARQKLLPVVERELMQITHLVRSSDDIFYEIYNPYTGAVDGGWQNGNTWDSCIHQTWSASSYFASIVHGVFGLDIQEHDIVLTPCVPEALSDSKITGLQIRNLTLNIELFGWGTHIAAIRVNNEPASSNRVPFGKVPRTITITLELNP